MRSVRTRAKKTRKGAKKWQRGEERHRSSVCQLLLLWFKEARVQEQEQRKKKKRKEKKGSASQVKPSQGLSEGVDELHLLVLFEPAWIWSIPFHSAKIG